ncbi:peroxiredoxin family protein [Stieleria sp. TO1_6]|uniref:peroxiredoxin family protein n=1 Tax=Stieleria tagensis TaxID=2956795 RepID=UPI00209B33FA|nr:peroxiredoxin family protein [Stieleria tagensis]MCO8120747.1 peroxiredoxin family protein [Stieleria tagensis]
MISNLSFQRIKFPTALNTCSLAVVLLAASVASAQTSTDSKIAKGKTAPEFQLQAVAGELSGEVKLSEVTKQGPVVLVVLRGFPGYQCPICSRQVADLISKANAFGKQDAKVLLVYPGPAAELAQRADEFLKGTKLPAPFTLLIDPDYEFTNAYGLRWDAPRETAYPSTFVIDQDGVIQSVKISKTHGDRSKASDVVKAVAAIAS